jgi:hypothetical protein
MKTYSGEFLTVVIDGGDWSVSRPGRFTPEEEHPILIQ